MMMEAGEFFNVLPSGLILFAITFQKKIKSCKWEGKGKEVLPHICRAGSIGTFYISLSSTETWREGECA